jgi:hypothetical protein
MPLVGAMLYVVSSVELSPSAPPESLELRCRMSEWRTPAWCKVVLLLRIVPRKVRVCRQMGIFVRLKINRLMSAILLWGLTEREIVLPLMLFISRDWRTPAGWRCLSSPLSLEESTSGGGVSVSYS